jgi:hypothetical protein
MKISSAFALVAALCLVLAATLASAYTVGLGADSRFVDTQTNTDGEVYNLEGLLLSLNHTIIKVSEYDNDTMWSETMDQADVLIFPENEVSSPLGTITNTTRDNIMSWVKTQRGVVVVFYGDYDLSNFLALLGSSGGAGNSPWLKTAAANESKIFGDDGPAQLEGMNAASSWSLSADDAKVVTCMYGSDDDCALWQYDMGKGRYFGAAPDYYDAAPYGSQDGGWVSALGLVFSAVPAASPTASSATRPVSFLAALL